MKSKYLIFIVVLFTFLEFVFCSGISSSFPLPGEDIYSQFIYISERYEQNLKKTRSHPIALRELKEPNSPILFYQKAYDAYCASSNLHEGAPLVKIDKTKDQVKVFDDVYHKIKINQTVEITLSEIIIRNTFSKTQYKNDIFTINITDEILINNVKAKIIIDVGSGYNDMRQTMIQTEKAINGFNTYAIIEENNVIKLTPLKTDDVIAYNSGTTYILKCTER